MKMDTSNIGLGCVTFGREITEEASFELLDYAVAGGITFFDTAAAYAHGASETIIGNWLVSRRPDLESLRIATKFQPPFTPARVSEVVAGSLSRLGVAALDLLYLHQWDETAASVDFLTALDREVTGGRVKAIGVSNFHRNELEQALSVQDRFGLRRFSVLQNNFNYAVSDVDFEYRTFCESQEIDVVTYSPLGAGFLTGKHRNGVAPGSRFDLIPGHQDVYFQKVSQDRLARLESLARESGHSPSHLALSWAMHQPGIQTVLIGARTTAHIDQAIAAREFDSTGLFREMESRISHESE
jgi:aryl-alcohol dehydrogenase-like predicted oxidoreductase